MIRRVHDDRRPCIVAGYDGSPAGRAAVALAARRAGPDGRLIVVHAYDVPADWLGWPDYPRILATAHEHGQELVRGLTARVPELRTLRWEWDVVRDRPAKAIAGVARRNHADEIVVGSRGFGRARALLGSAAHELIHLAQQPVTVIPARAVGDEEGAVAEHHARHVVAR